MIVTPPTPYLLYSSITTITIMQAYPASSNKKGFEKAWGFCGESIGGERGGVVDSFGGLAGVLRRELW
jgi:hypothetical protein